METSKAESQAGPSAAEMERSVKELQRTVLAGRVEIIKSTLERLEALPGELTKGLNEVARLFKVQFGAGIALLVLSVVFYMFKYEVLTYIFGATGGVTLVGTFIKTPPLQLQKNRIDLSQWMIAYFNWFNTLLGTSDLIAAMQQTGTLTWDGFRELHTFLLTTTEKTLRVIDECCEFDAARAASRQGGPGPDKAQP